MLAQKVEAWPIEPGSFAQVLLALARRVPEAKRLAILPTVQLLARGYLAHDREAGQRPYSIARHQEVWQLTATIRGSLAAAIAAERDERG